MKLKSAFSVILGLLLTANLCSPLYGAELHTRYATIIYDDDNMLRKFNREVVTSGRFSRLFSSRKNTTLEDEVRTKVDSIVKKVEAILDMFPANMKLRINLLPSTREVQDVYFRKYRKKTNFISYYSPQERTVYLSMKNVELRVFAHELAHAVIHHYFRVPPSSKIHEVLAQYVENQITH